VEITQEFWLGAYEVTQKQYRTIMGTNPSWFSSSGNGKDKMIGMNTEDFPVEQVSWEDAVEVCKALTERDAKKPDGWVYRLPTEAEWEYASRGGVPSYQVFYFGHSLSSEQANFDGNSPYGGSEKGPYLERTCKVGSYQKNGFGLYDMHGNVWEWCHDWYDRTSYVTSPLRDPQGPPVGVNRVIRGGSWFNNGQSCRSANRFSNEPAFRNLNLGFRVALVPAGK
jgi:formylglycine-generating enzyme required for sulfatase activity